MEWLNLGDSVNQLALLGAIAILALTIFVVGGYIKKMKIKMKILHKIFKMTL